MRERVVVGGRVAEIEAHEDHRRRAVRQHLHVARNEAEVLRVPGASGLEVGDLEHDVAELNDFRCAQGWALGAVDASPNIADVPRQRCAAWQRVRAGPPVDGLDGEAGGIRQRHAFAATRMRRGLRWARTGQARKRIERGARRNVEPEAHESSFLRALDPIAVRRGGGAPQVQRLRAAARDREPKIA